nr:uncharacterized protein LOC113812892 [Penaeus vannamei]
MDNGTVNPQVPLLTGPHAAHDICLSEYFTEDSLLGERTPHSLTSLSKKRYQFATAEITESPTTKGIYFSLLEPMITSKLCDQGSMMAISDTTAHPKERQRDKILGFRGVSKSRNPGCMSRPQIRAPTPKTPNPGANSTDPKPGPTTDPNPAPTPTDPKSGRQLPQTPNPGANNSHRPQIRAPTPTDPKPGRQLPQTPNPAPAAPLARARSPSQFSRAIGSIAAISDTNIYIGKAGTTYKDRAGHSSSDGLVRLLIKPKQTRVYNCCRQEKTKEITRMNSIH